MSFVIFVVLTGLTATCILLAQELAHQRWLAKFRGECSDHWHRQYRRELELRIATIDQFKSALLWKGDE